MLEQLDLDAEISKSTYREARARYEPELGALQRQARELGIPVLIVFEGWGAAGKGVLINNLISALDPRGFNVYSTQAVSDDEVWRPFLWRFWTKTPARGRIAVFDRSWYRQVLLGRVSGKCRGRHVEQAFEDILSFERQLAADGALIVKLFLHISRHEQKHRFHRLEKDPATAWRVTKADWAQNKAYAKHAAVAEDMLARTDWSGAPWTAVASHQEEYATLRVFETVNAALRERCAAAADTRPSTAPARRRAARGAPSILARVDLRHQRDGDGDTDRLDDLQKELRELEFRMYRRRVPAVVVFEGWDAAGKGGAIKRLTRELDPRGYEVVPVSAPNDIEKAHHYLWRFWMHMPKAGHLAIFDRSWYGRVLVERVEGFCPESDWRRAYAEINEMERHLANFGTVMVKLWLHIDKREQLRRFREREQDPSKGWKITADDWRNRANWKLYETAVDDMIRHTSTAYAPWTIVESNCKPFARVKTLETVIAALRKALQ